MILRLENRRNLRPRKIHAAIIALLAAVGLLMPTTTAPLLFGAGAAWAKDGSSGHGDGGSGGSGHGGSGGGSGSSGGSGHDDGGHSGHGRAGDGGSRGNRSGKTDARRSKDAGAGRSSVVWSSRRDGAVEVRYGDGWSEKVEGPRYTLRDPGRSVVASRPARESDRARLEAIAE